MSKTHTILQQSLFGIVTMILILAAVCIRSILHPYPIETPEEQSITSRIAATVVLAICGLIAGYIASKCESTSPKKQYAYPFYAIASCGIYCAPNPIPTSLCALISMIAFLRMTSYIKNPKDRSSLFISSLLIGILPLLDPIWCILAVAFPLLVIVLSLSLRKSIIMLAGMLLPLFAVSYIKWYMGDGFLQYTLSRFGSFGFLEPIQSFETLPIMAILIASLLAINTIAGICHVHATRLVNIHARKTMSVCTVLVISGSCGLTLGTLPVSMLPVIALPTSLFACYTLDYESTRLGNILYLLLIVSVFLHFFIE